MRFLTPLFAGFDRRRPHIGGLLIVGLVATVSGLLPLEAGSLILENGLFLKGEPIKRQGIRLESVRRSGPNENPIYPLMTVEDGVRRYFFPFRHADRDSVETGADIGLEEYTNNHRTPPASTEPADIGRIDQATPFATRAGRKLTVQTERGPVEISQIASTVRPDYVAVSSLNIAWEYGLLTTEVSDKSLLALIDHATNPSSLSDMLSRIGFLVQAGRLELARKEMEYLAGNFPEAQARAESFSKQLDALTGMKALREIKERRQGGQHEMVMRICKLLRDSPRVSAAVADQADEILFEYEELIRMHDDITFHLGDLEGMLEEPDAALVRPLRSQLLTELHADTVDRLKSFLDSLDDNTLAADEKLALAYSAWVAGPSNATTDLLDAVDYWTLRAAILDYLRADNRYLRDDRWPAIDVIEGVDINDLEAMIPLLPPIHPPADVGPESIATLKTESGVSYVVQLPPEFSPYRSYPVLVALHEQGLKPELELAWWAGSPERSDLGRERGYIVVAPDYLAGDAGPTAKTHDRLRDVVIDVRKRFSVDSNRVFLVGHGVGADVVWDYGLACPQLWAGLVPIGGKCSQSVKLAHENARYTKIFAVNGGLDANSFLNNAATIQRMMESRHNVILCEYMNRGRETFAAEKPRIFDWLGLQVRDPMPREIDATVFHGPDADWDWYAAAPKSNVAPPARGERRAGQRLNATITLGNKVYLGSQPATLRFSPALINFEERVRFSYGSQRLKTQVLNPSMKTMLEDFATRFDRQRLFWAELSVP